MERLMDQKVLAQGDRAGKVEKPGLKVSCLSFVIITFINLVIVNQIFKYAFQHTLYANNLNF